MNVGDYVCLAGRKAIILRIVDSEHTEVQFVGAETLVILSKYMVASTVDGVCPPLIPKTKTQ
jgi:hypothetical protein